MHWSLATRASARVFARKERIDAVGQETTGPKARRGHAPKRDGIHPPNGVGSNGFNELGFDVEYI